MPRNAKASSHESRRDAASRNLSEVLGPAPELPLAQVRDEYLDLSLGDSTNVSNAVLDWGEKPARRQHMKTIGITLRPMVGGVGLNLLDVRSGRLNIGCWFAFNFENAGELGDGMARILPHNGFSFVRPTRSWVDDPRGGSVRCIEADLPRPHFLAVGRGALISERRGKQLFFWSSFGIGGLAVHVGAGTTTDDTSSIFDNTTNGLAGLFKRVILTAGNPHGSDGIQAWPASRAAAGGGFLTLSTYRQDDAGAQFYWQLQRGSDAFWWNEGTRAWQAGRVSNAAPTIMTVTGFEVLSRAIPSTATNYQFFGVQLSGGTVSRVNSVHHVQLEEKRFESSPMPLTSAYIEGCPGFRDDDLLQACNDVGARVFVRERGTLLTRFVPRWSTADVDGLKLHVGAVEFDSGNSVAIYYDGVNSTKNRFVLEIRSGGATVTLAAVYPVTRYTEIRFGMRWASGTYNELEAEYGTPSAGNAWYDLWAGSTLLASGIQAPMPIETNESRLQVMCRDGENIDGFPEDFIILKTVLTAAEMAAAL